MISTGHPVASAPIPERRASCGHRRNALVATTRTESAARPLRGAVKAPGHFDGERNGFGRQEAVVKDGFSQRVTSRLVIRRDDEIGREIFQADGVDPMSTGGEGWHSATVVQLGERRF